MNLSRNHFRRTTLMVDSPKILAVHINKKPPSSRVLYVGENLDSLPLRQSIIVISPQQINQFLGQEFDCILFDASDDFNVNAFTAIVGTLVGGGELILNIPADIEEAIKAGLNEDLTASPLLYRFVREIRLSLNQPIKPALESNAKYLIEQQQLIEKIVRCAIGHAKRPLVLTANRGRGKSACLGMAAAELVNQHNKRIIITAPRKTNLEIFFKYADQDHSNSPRTNRQTEDSNNELINKQDNIYYPPDKLLKEKPQADLLIIDEAGAIPVQMLQQMVNRYNRVVLSTTVDGYEGNGRGFDIRFKSTLAERFPQWRRATLVHPMRWPKNDPLEIATNSAFLLNSSSEKILSPENTKDLTFQPVTKSTLLNDEELLKQIYSLLVNAHYQTRPSDLDRMLSDSALRVFVAFYKTQVVATALVSIEGNLSIQQCQEIEKAKSRLPGHLLPQSLMAYQGIQGAGKFTFWRIMRIAVSPEFQRKKIASQLIKHIEQQATNQSVDVLGASFSLSPNVIQFWYQMAFSCCRIALRKDSSTGSYPGEFIKLVDTAKSEAKTKINSAILRFELSFYYSMSASYSDIQTEILVCILKNQGHSQIRKLTKEIESDITRYIEKARGFEMVEWQLSQLLKLYFTGEPTEQALSHSAECLLVAKLLQKKTWKYVIEEFEFKGIKMAKEAVRNAVSELALLLTPK